MHDEIPTNVRRSQQTKVLPAQVPRRFPVRTMLGLIAMFAIMLSVWRTLGVPPIMMVILLVWVVTIALAQVLLFQGKRPRLASACVGVGAGLLCFVILLITWRKLSHEQVLIGFVAALAFFTFLGYATGAALATVFLVDHRIRTGRWNETQIVAPGGMPFAAVPLKPEPGPSATVPAVDDSAPSHPD